ncbi:conserved protein of unknown function [Mesotoga infera]|uniref:Uncharacterized protein n=1 Tax=Mesotoga infera TaxID=1236046 RepID=A0A7Z7LED7_9BACT|nr:hypothetical protein [Mesotoga infera]SSC12326.1 conserved protein of unknown function [Mesotoga infera]
MRKGLVLPLSLIIMASITIIAVALLNRTSSTTSELFQNISKSQLQVDAGNVFYANYGYLRKKFAEESFLNLSTNSFYISLISTPSSLETFLSLFDNNTLENQSWNTLFSRFSQDRFFKPGSDLRSIFEELTDGTFEDLVMIPDKSSPNTYLAVVITSNGAMKSYFWGVISPRYFSNWSRFVLESNSTAQWFPGSVIYGPTFLGSTGQGGAGNGGLRMIATIPPGSGDLSIYGPIFNGEIWYENSNLDLTGSWTGRKTIRVDTNGDGVYDETYNNKDYAIHVENGETWIYLGGFNEIIVAESYSEVSGELRVKGKIENFVNNSKGEFNDRFIPWFIKAGSMKVDQETITELEKRFDEMEDYYQSHYSNTTSLEDMLNALERGSVLPQNSLGLYLRDTERSSGSQVTESETTELIKDENTQWLMNLLVNDEDFLDLFRDWIIDNNERKLSANFILNNDLTSEDFTYDELRQVVNSDYVTLSVNESPIIEERRTIIQTEITSGVRILDNADSVDMSSDVLFGAPLNNLVGTGGFESSTPYSVIRFKWNREVRTSVNHQVRERSRTISRYPLEYENGPISFTLNFTGWKWKKEWQWEWPGGWIQQWQRVRQGWQYQIKQWDNNYSVNGPTTVSSWSDWNYSEWSEWNVISGSGGQGRKVADADVEMYFITPSSGFSAMNFDTTVIMKVNSDDEDYPSFTTEATSFLNKGYYVVEEDISTGGSGITGGIGKTLGREASVIDGKYTIRSKQGDIKLYGDILYYDMLSDNTFRGYVNQPGLEFAADYDPNTSATNLNDMINLVATDGNIIIPFQDTKEGKDAIRNIKLFSNLFAFGKNSGHSNTGQILIENYDRYSVNLGYRHVFGTMVSVEAGPAGSGNNGFRSRNYYDERLYGNIDMPFGSPESNLLEVLSVSMK